MTSTEPVEWTVHHTESIRGVASHQRTGAVVTEPPNNSREKFSYLHKWDYWNVIYHQERTQCPTSTLPNETTLNKHTCQRTTCIGTRKAGKIVRTKKLCVNCRSNPCGFGAPFTSNAKRGRINPYQWPVPNRKKNAVPRINLHLFRGERQEPKQAKQT